jgi:catechol 2,3-dioxygenase-like lactoylglutathione lyase family enzyme
MSPTQFHHVAISVRNLEESIAWYEDIFGLTVQATLKIPHNTTRVAFVGTKEFCIEILEVPGSAPLPEGRSHPDEDNLTLGVKHLCLIVDDPVEFTERARSKGVKVAFEVQDMPGGYVSFINDPTGNIIEIFKRGYDVSANPGITPGILKA